MRVFVGITGASGSLYARRLVEEMGKAGVEIFLSVSRMGAVVARAELDAKIDLDPPPGRSPFEPDLGASFTYYADDDLTAPPASGTFPLDAVVVIPASADTVAAIASGLASTLIRRAADVALKEKRRLIVVPRETPLSAIQLENMARLARAGAVVLPAMPAFYTAPRTVDDLIDFVVGKVMDALGIPHRLFRRWGEPAR